MEAERLAKTPSPTDRRQRPPSCALWEGPVLLLCAAAIPGACGCHQAILAGAVGVARPRCTCMPTRGGGLAWAFWTRALHWCKTLSVGTFSPAMKGTEAFSPTLEALTHSLSPSSDLPCGLLESGHRPLSIAWVPIWFEIPTDLPGPAPSHAWETV